MMLISGLMKVTLLDYPEHVACTVFTGGCNFRCPFCYNSGLLGSDTPALMETGEFFDFLSRRVGRLEGVAITGGEPTLQKDLPDFICEIRSRFGMDVKLDTNGTNPEMLSMLIDEGLINYAAMDIKAAPDRYSLAAGVGIGGGLWDRISTSKDLLLEGRIPYEFRTTVVGGLHNDEDFIGIGGYIRGAEHYYLQRYSDNEHVLEKEAGYYPPGIEDMLRYLDIVRPLVPSAELRGVE